MESTSIKGSDTGNAIGPSMDVMEDADGMGKDGDKGSWLSAWKATREELNLSGLLNVLAGQDVSNDHQPSRNAWPCTYQTREDWQDPGILVAMLEHYFQTKLNEIQVDRVRDAVNDPPQLKFTPAEVEQMAYEPMILTTWFLRLKRRNILNVETLM